MDRFSLLIVDDDEATHEVLGEYLELAGFRVFHARDGSEGLEFIAELRPDAVLLDVNMPVMDGFRTMEAIGKSTELRDVPVLFLTSLDRSNLKIRGLELGAEDYIVKPFNKAELLARVNAAVRRGARYKRNENAMEGSFADISLAELLQTLDIGRKTACIRLVDLAGLICVSGGAITHASFRDFAGIEAVTRLFFLERGAFSVTFGQGPHSAAAPPMPIQNALFETMTYIDELKAMLSAISGQNDLVEIHDTGVTEIDRLRPLSPVKLYDVVVLMGGDLKGNAATVSDALEKGTITVAAEGGMNA